MSITDSLLFLAIANGDLVEVGRLLDETDRPVTISRDMVIAAITNGHLGVIRLLLSTGDIVDVRTDKAIAALATSDDYVIFNALIDYHKSDKNYINNLMMRCISVGSVNLLKGLCEHEQCSLENLERLPSVWECSIELITVLIKYGIDVSVHGEEILSKAVASGDVPTVAWMTTSMCGKHLRVSDSIIDDLVINGDVEILDILINTAVLSIKPTTRLILAARYNQIAVIELLLTEDACISHNQNIVLRTAARYCDADTVGYLLDNGADPSAIHNQAYYTAVKYGNHEVGCLLLEHITTDEHHTHRLEQISTDYGVGVSD